jgi:putative transcriptional regulator
VGLPDRGGVPLPLQGPTPCSGPALQATAQVTDPEFREAQVLICGDDEAGALGFFVNRTLPAPARPLFRIPGNVHLGGPLMVSQGVLLHRTPEGVFWTSSRNAAGAVSRDPVPSGLVFGHARWGAGQLQAEIEAGAWTTIDAVGFP